MRSLLWLLPLAMLTLAACEQFNGHIDPVPDPGPGPGPDPDPDPDPDPETGPMREVVFTPGTTVTAGTTIDGTTTGDPFADGDTIAWTLTPDTATAAMLPTGAGPVIFPSLTQLTSTITTDSVSPLPARWRVPAPGTYGITVREEGDDYDPIVRNFTISANAAAPTELRPESTEILGVPLPGEESALEGVLMAVHSLGVSTGSDGLGDILTLMVRQTRKDTVSEESVHEYALYLGDVESGVWSSPIVLSVDARDRVPASPLFPLREYGITIQQSFGQATAGRQISCVWQDSTGQFAWVEATLSAGAGGALDCDLSTRVALASLSGSRMAPISNPAGTTIVTATSGTPDATMSFTSFELDADSGTATRRFADIIRGTEGTERIVGHDAAFRSDGSLVLAALERRDLSDTMPTLHFVQLPANLTGPATFTTLGSDTKVVEPPAIYVATGDVIHIAHLGDPDVTYFRQRSGTTFESRTLAGTSEGTIRTLRMAESDVAPGEVLLVAQYATGVIIENIVGTLRFHRISVAADGAFDAIGTLLPASALDIADQGPANIAGSSNAIHVVWQQTGIGLNRNTRLLEARTH